MLERFDLQGKVILLTGGSGRYGRGLTSDLAAAHATLIIASRSLEANEAAAAEERAKGHDVTAEILDQGDEASILALREKILQRHGQIDGLVNNSVARTMSGPEDSAETWEQSMRVNATGVFLLHRIFGEALCARRSGSIVNIGSIQGMVGPSLDLYAGTDMPYGSPDYFFHKSGMINLTRYYAAHFGPSQVRVNCLSPGGFFNNQPQAFLDRYNAQTFLNRMADSTDLGGAVVFLLSEASRYITGVNLPVDGGYSAH
jgi:NAD(P)-dependent dehydrogenase (short-subunit alcohol dehydrogenase family)